MAIWLLNWLFNTKIILASLSTGANWYGLAQYRPPELLFCGDFSSKGWNHLWIESVSQNVVLAFSNVHMVPWTTRNCWSNCMEMVRNKRCIFIHIFRVGNCIVDALAKHGHNLSDELWWKDVPSFIRPFYFRDLLGFPNFRFVLQSGLCCMSSQSCNPSFFRFNIFLYLIKKNQIK